MVVYGGCLQNNSITGDMIALDLQYYEWSRILIKGTKIEPVMQGQCCSVTLPANSVSRMFGQ